MASRHCSHQKSKISPTGDTFLGFIDYITYHFWNFNEIEPLSYSKPKVYVNCPKPVLFHFKATAGNSFEWKCVATVWMKVCGNRAKICLIIFTLFNVHLNLLIPNFEIKLVWIHNICYKWVKLFLTKQYSLGINWTKSFCLIFYFPFFTHDF